MFDFIKVTKRAVRNFPSSFQCLTFFIKVTRHHLHQLKRCKFCWGRSLFLLLACHMSCSYFVFLLSPQIQRKKQSVSFSEIGYNWLGTQEAGSGGLACNPERCWNQHKKKANKDICMCLVGNFCKDLLFFCIDVAKPDTCCAIEEVF